MATRALTDLGRPVLDFVALAHGMGVPAARAGSAEELTSLLSKALASEGPTLIQADLQG